MSQECGSVAQVIDRNYGGDWNSMKRGRCSGIQSFADDDVVVVVVVESLSTTNVFPLPPGPDRLCWL